MERTLRIKPDGTIWVEEIQTYEVTPQSVFNQILSDLWFPIPNILPNTMFFLNHSTNVVQVVTQLFALPFNCNWTITENKLVPASSKNESDIVKQLLWKVPETIRMYLCTNLVKGRYDNSCLLCKINKEIYSPPFPNIFENGSICMGTWNPPRASLAEIAQSCLDFFLASNYNFDLMLDKLEHFRNWVQYDLHEKQIEPEITDSYLSTAHYKPVTIFNSTLLGDVWVC